MRRIITLKFLKTVFIIQFLVICTIATGQDQVNGTVTDLSGEPLIGVNILVEGTNNGTSTDFNGEFTLQNVNLDSDVLIISYVGYKTTRLPLDGENNLNITLESDTELLDEIVVVGYGTQSRGELTTSVSKLNEKVFDNIPYSNPATAMEGEIAGVRVQSTSGQPGSGPNIVIRGGTSINNPNSSPPLYIIDGVYRDDMNDINANDIESIQVLKDAASTAIYGARGSNGVVIIVTKSGKSGSMQVKYDYDITSSTNPREYDILKGKDEVYFARLGMAATANLNSAIAPQLNGNVYLGGIGYDLTNNTYSTVQYLNSENEHKLNEGWESIPDPLDPSQTIIFNSTDWQDILFRNAISQNHSLSISGGGEIVNFYLGLGYNDSEGVAIQTNYNRLSMNFNATAKISNNIDVTARLTYANRNDRQVPSIGSIFKSALIAPTTNKLYFEDGSYATGRNFGYSNPFYQLSTYKPKNRSDDLTLSIESNINITKNLSFKPNISVRKTNDYLRNFQRAYMNGPSTEVVSRNATGTYVQLLSPQFAGVLTYQNSWRSSHNFEINAGFSYYENNNISLTARGSNASTDLIPTLNASATPVAVSSSESKHRLTGYFGRASYNFKKKYLFNTSLRYDGASNLGSNNKWGLFPGVSLGWNIDKENFWTVFPEDLIKLKLRASYGVTGNISGLGYYQAQGEYSAATLYDGNAGIQLGALPNQDLKWEESKTFDIGLDIGLFDYRLGIVLDLYRRETSNLLTTLNLPPSSGFPSILTNYGELENKGIEAEIKAHILPPNSDLQWNLNFNIAQVDTRILKLPENGVENNRIGGEYVFDPSINDYAYLGGLQEGGRIGDLFGYKQIGIYATDEEAANGPTDMLIPRTDKTKYGGDVNWYDVDGNGIIDPRDRVYMGNQIPTLTGGFSNYLTYKNVSLSVRMDYTAGATIYFETGARLEGNFSGANAISNHMLRSWQEQGDITNIPRYYWADQNAQWNVWNGRGSSRFYQKLDFLCIREVSLGYSLPSTILEKLNISGFRLNITGSNLHYFTKYEGLNPEQTNTDAAYPIPRNITLGASITL